METVSSLMEQRGGIALDVGEKAGRTQLKPTAPRCDIIGRAVSRVANREKSAIVHSSTTLLYIITETESAKIFFACSRVWAPIGPPEPTD